MSEGTRRSLMFLAAGRHSRLPAVARLRSACLTTLIALVAEFGLGMWLNLYVPVPAADQHAGIVKEIANGPLMITVHILVGAFLIGAAIVMLTRAVSIGHTKVVVLAAISLAAIAGAFGAGDFFARDGEPRTSLWMALFTGIAMLCCVYVQAFTGAADMTLADGRSGSEPEPGWPDFRQASGTGRRPPRYGQAMPSGPAPAYGRAATGPRPAYPGSPRSQGSPGSSGPMPRPRDPYPPAYSPAMPWNDIRRQPDLPDYGYPEQR